MQKEKPNEIALSQRETESFLSIFPLYLYTTLVVYINTSLDVCWIYVFVKLGKKVKKKYKFYVDSNNNNDDEEKKKTLPGIKTVFFSLRFFRCFMPSHHHPYPEIIYGDRMIKGIRVAFLWTQNFIYFFILENWLKGIRNWFWTTWFISDIWLSRLLFFVFSLRLFPFCWI